MRQFAFVFGVGVAVCACGGTTMTPTPNTTPVMGTCGFSVSQSDTTRSISAEGGAMSVRVTTPGRADACTWTVSINDDARTFVTLVDPPSGSSTATDATVTMAVAANTGGERRGTVSIAGVTFTIDQTAAACAFTLSGDLNTTFPAGGGTGHVAVALSRGGTCPWTASSSANFVSVSPASGTNSGSVTFDVQANTASQARAATLTIAGQSVVVNQAGVGAAIPPSIATVSPTSIPVGPAQITLTGSNFDPASVQLVVTGPACPTATPCVVPNGTLISRTATQIVAPVTLLNTGSFLIQAQNGAGAPLSNGVSLTVTASPQPTPSISSLSPLSMAVGSASLTITGSGFDPSSAQVVVIGPGCPASSPCLVPNGALTSRSSTQLVAPVTLLTAGAYSIQVQNGSGALSNALTLTVNTPPPPVITGLSPTSITVGSASLTIVGTGFDPATAQIVVTGPSCAASSPCIVPNATLTSRSATQIVAPVTLLSPGSFSIQVQNGSGGALSNSVTVTVR